jgi:hypothetical protein
MVRFTVRMLMALFVDSMIRLALSANDSVSIPSAFHIANSGLDFSTDNETGDMRLRSCTRTTTRPSNGKAPFLFPRFGRSRSFIQRSHHNETMSPLTVHLAPLLFPSTTITCHGPSSRSLVSSLFAAQFFASPLRRGGRREGFLAKHPDRLGGA